jgi:hypothetical protein
LKIQYRLLIGLVGLLAVAAVSNYWTNAIISSLIEYRSPLQHSPPAPGTPLGESITRRVVIVLIDGLRWDISTDTSLMPFLNKLRDQGASAVMHSHPPSFSQPGYATLLTGAWPDLNDGPSVNLDYSQIPVLTQDDLFSAAHRAGLRTAISSYFWFEKLLPLHAVDKSFYTSGEDARADQTVLYAALPMLAGDYQLVLIHLDQVDYASHHLGGPLSPEGKLAAKNIDHYLHEIDAALDLEQDTLVVLSDHGQIDQGGHGGPDPVTLVEPFVMAGAGVRPAKYGSIQMVDVASTIGALLGINIPATSQGAVQTDMLLLSPSYKTYIHSAEMTQKQALLNAYEAALNVRINDPRDLDDIQAYTIAMDAARAAQLSQERVWRGLVAVILALLPIAILLFRKDKKAVWLAAGGLTFIILFNIRFLLIDGRTYSLSSMESASWLIQYLTVTTSISLTVGWLLAMLGRQGFNNSPLQAAGISMDFVYFTLYLLGLPILLSFAINGVVVTWTLPEFYTIFVALIALILWRFVVAFGFLLTVTAVISTYIRRRPTRH